MSGIALNALYDTCKQQINTPSNIYDLGQLTCRTIQKCREEEDPTVSKIQNLILNPARNLLEIYNLQDNLFKLWELPSLLQGLQTVKNTCDALPIFSAINLIGSTSLGYVPCIKTPISFIQSSCLLKSSIEAVLPSVKLEQTNKLNKKNIAIRNLLNELIIVDNILQNEKTSFKQNKLYEVCQNLEQLIPQISKSADSNPHEALGILNRMILNSDDINKSLNSSEISKLKEILRQSIVEEGYNLETLNKISDQFKTHLDTVDNISNTKSLLEVLKCAISWLLGVSGMLNLFFLGAGGLGTVLFSLEICGFIVRLTISFYKNYLINM